MPTVDASVNLNGLLPGQIWNVDDQCKQIYGAGSFYLKVNFQNIFSLLDKTDSIFLNYIKNEINSICNRIYCFYNGNFVSTPQGAAEGKFFTLFLSTNAAHRSK